MDPMTGKGGCLCGAVAFAARSFDFGIKAGIALFLCLVAVPVLAQATTAVPESPDPDRIHLIYLHGRVVEDLGPRPTDPRFGVYDYPAVLESLARRGAVVISAQRRPGTNVNEYAGIVIAQVEQLIRRGIAPENIVVVGFSKGGDIAIRVSSFLRRPQVRFVLLAACWPRPGQDQLRLTGRVLSIRETSDTLAGDSCQPLVEHEEKPASFEELSISTGRSHGAFYTPLEDWLDPVLDWVHGP